MELRQEHSEDAKRCRMQSAGGISCLLTKLCMAYGHPFALNFGLDRCLPPVCGCTTHALAPEIGFQELRCRLRDRKLLFKRLRELEASLKSLSSLGVQSFTNAFIFLAPKAELALKANREDEIRQEWEARSGTLC